MIESFALSDLLASIPVLTVILVSYNIYKSRLETKASDIDIEYVHQRNNFKHLQDGGLKYTLGLIAINNGERNGIIERVFLDEIMIVNDGSVEDYVPESDIDYWTIETSPEEYEDWIDVPPEETIRFDVTAFLSGEDIKERYDQNLLPVFKFEIRDHSQHYLEEIHGKLEWYEDDYEPSGLEWVSGAE
ncbi:urease accessory protein UreE [Haloterrigena salina]|uniref:hypothetical protein n=1 Tax=Haloterrigena salina TaxID=504937 RepID=UPI0012679041|nr:hypothetical protein [Haloterrigena salina]